MMRGQANIKNTSLLCTMSHQFSDLQIQASFAPSIIQTTERHFLYNKDLKQLFSLTT